MHYSQKLALAVLAGAVLLNSCTEQKSGQNVVVQVNTATPSPVPIPTPAHGSNMSTPFPDSFPSPVNFNTPSPTPLMIGGGSGPPPTPIPFNGPNVTTWAGSGINGFADGPAAQAQFAEPTGITVAKDGTIFVADQDNHRIRMISADGSTVSTVAGRTGGFADGMALQAQFNFPAGLALDNSGNVYIADSSNHRVRQLVLSSAAPSGTVTTMAGNGTAGFKDGNTNESQLNTPWDLDVDASGTVYVADSVNQRIRKITAGGVSTTLAGAGNSGYKDGLGTEAQFNFPHSVSLDSGGNLYVADSYNNRIRKITPAGAVTTVAGTGEKGFKDGPAKEAMFAGPLGIRVDNQGNIYVADTDNHRIRMISADGMVQTVAGSGTEGFADGAALSARFNQPRRIAIDSKGYLYVTERRNERIRKIMLRP